MYSADSKAGHNCFTGNMFKSLNENNIKTKKKACYRQLNLSLIPTCNSKIHGCDRHWAEGTPCRNSAPSTVASRAEPRSWMSWRGSCVSSFSQSLQLWMNPRVKEASKQISGSLKGLDMAPAQHTIARAWKSSNVHSRLPAIHMLVLLLFCYHVLLMDVTEASRKKKKMLLLLLLLQQVRSEGIILHLM